MNLHEHDDPCSGHNGHAHHEHVCDEHCHHDGEITIMLHDEAIVGTVSIHLHLAFGPVKSITQDIIRELSLWTEASGGIVGHIKAFISADEESCSLSLTESDVNTVNEGYHISLNINAILFGVSEHQLHDKLAELIEKYKQQ